MRKIFLAVNLLLMGLLVSGCSSSQSNMVLNGVVETSIYSHYSEVPGKIIELPVELGQEVKAGDLIAVLDNSDAKYSLEQLETTLTKKQAALT
ncbi:MAG TPA: biotin/lipoyl-binding protein, partial [Syntrophomonas sp.]|nr:biotin/lipoyl-binding protein [Syntrophomonas sp.]